MTLAEQQEREAERYERQLERQGNLEDTILREFSRLYNSGEYSDAFNYVSDRKRNIERLWGNDPDVDVQQSASKLVEVCDELMADARNAGDMIKYLEAQNEAD